MHSLITGLTGGRFNSLAPLRRDCKRAIIRTIQFSCQFSIRIVVLLLVFVLTGCSGSRRNEQLSETRLFLDTFCTITIHGEVEQGLLDEAFEYLSELEALLSFTAEGSDVRRINNAGGEPVVVDSRTVEVITTGLEFGELSGGLFDITIGRLSSLWSINNADLSVPDDADIAEALATVDYRQVIIDGNTVQLLNPDSRIDLGAVGKGYIADRIAEFLVSNGVSGALINLGGDVVAVGSRIDGEPWRIALRKPFDGVEEWLGVVEVEWLSVIGSGVYERYFEIDEKKYHHILDPFTGKPADSDVVSATVITEVAMIGEGLSTIAVLTGSEGLHELFEGIRGFVGAVIVLETGELIKYGNVELVATG